LDDIGIDLKWSANGCGITPLLARRKNIRAYHMGRCTQPLLPDACASFQELYPIERAASWPHAKVPVREQSRIREQISLSGAAGQL
jgi:hypothetical protein